MTHRELVALAARWLAGTRGCAVVASERHAFMSAESPDAIGWRPNGDSILVEAKCSLSDLWADYRKPHRQFVGMGLERWYLAERGVLPLEHVHPAWGLLEIRNGKVFRARPAAVRSEFAKEIAHTERPFLVAVVRRGAAAPGVIVEPVEEEAA